MSIIASLVDWMIIAVLAVPFIAVLMGIAFTDVRREHRRDRESAKLRHPSAQPRSIVPKDFPKAA